MSDDIMHVTDWFTTIIRAAGAAAPSDREIDGVDQLSWLTGGNEHSAREGYLYWMGSEMYGAKWRNFKISLVVQRYATDAPMKLAVPRLTNLITDPHEREPVPLPYLHTWVATHVNGLIAEYAASIRREALIPLGAPLEFVPVRQ